MMSVVVYQMADVVLLALSNVRFFTRILLYIKIGTGTDSIWCGGINNCLHNIVFKNTLPFSLASSNISSSRKLEYEEEVYHEWLQE